MEILDLEQQYKELELEVKMRDFRNSKLPLFYAKFKDSDVVDGNVIRGVYGNGNTIDEAIQDYCKEISGRVLVINRYSDNPKTFFIPKVKHTKLFGK